jgi:P4 family phage/plasmid primase-like protien
MADLSPTPAPINGPDPDQPGERSHVAGLNGVPVNGPMPTDKPHMPKAMAVTPENPCRICAATAGCRVDSRRARIGCLHKDGPLSVKSTIAETGQPCFVHEYDPTTGRVLEPVPDETARFLAALFADDDRVVMRPTEAWIEGGRKRSRVIYKAVLHHTAERFRTNARFWTILQWAAETQNANLFFGVCPRFGGGRFDLAWQIRTVRALWADLDHCKPEEALKRCEDAGLPRPSIVVCSGHGVHLYWLLSEACLIDDAGGDPPPVLTGWVKQPDGKSKPRKFVKGSDGEVHYLHPQDAKTKADSSAPNPAFPFRRSAKAIHIQDILAGIASKIGGDHTTDLARLLRLPGTLNRKDARNGKEPVPCVLLECDPARRYPFTDFERFAQASPDKARREKVVQVRLPSGARFAGRRLGRLNDLINACALEAVGARSERDFHLCAWCVEQGLDRERVWSEVQSVGKFAEKGRGYFDRTWEAAEGKTREKIYERATRKAGEGRPSANGTNRAGREAAPASNDGAFGSGDPPDRGEATDGQESSRPNAVNEAINEPHRLGRIWLRTHAAHPDRCMAAFYREQFHIWTGTHWAARPDAEMKAALSKFCKRQLDDDNAWICEGWQGDGPPPTVPKVTTALVGNVMLAISGDVLIAAENPQPYWLGPDPGPRNWMALRNGLLDIEALLAGAQQPLRPHSPLWFSPSCLPFDFDPRADCPLWKAFLARNLGDDPGKVLLLQEWAGYVICHGSSLQKMLMMVGEGANGKSVVIAAFLALLGEDNVSTVPLELFGERFRLVGTVGKLLNLMAEVGEIDKVAEGQLKAFVVGDPIEVEKKYKQPFTVRPTARIMLATNNAPQFSDKSDGIWRRALLLPFIIQIPPEEQVKGMDKPDFWQAAGEPPGILNWALVGLHRLRANKGAFTVPQSCREAVEKLRADSNPARRFLLDRYECDPTAGWQAAKDEVYQDYRVWCGANGHHPLAEIGFGREVMRTFKNGVKADKSSPDGSGRRHPVYKGLRRIHNGEGL